jgi:hypothetical protein
VTLVSESKKRLPKNNTESQLDEKNPVMSEVEGFSGTKLSISYPDTYFANSIIGKILGPGVNFLKSVRKYSAAFNFSVRQTGIF